MQFSIPTNNGKRLFNDVFSRKELRFAFRNLRKTGHAKDSIILRAVIDKYKELTPNAR